MILLYSVLKLQKTLFSYNCAIHLPSSLKKVVGLVHQKDIVLLHGISKESPKIYEWVKNIVIVADNSIGPKAHIQGHLEGAHLIFPGILRYFFPVETVLITQKIKNSLIYPVIVTLGIGAGIRITVSLLFSKEADLVLGGYCDAL